MSEARLRWPDRVKAIALAWIFLNHVVEPLFGPPLIANPTADWPPLAARVEQLRPQSGHGIAADAAMNAVRYLGWFGDQGVQLFLIVSGFGLAYGLLASGATGRLNAGSFYRRRLARLYPLWIAAHVGVGLASVIGVGPEVSARTWLLSAIGFRATPGLFYSISAAWWYIGLLIQLYVVFPLLWSAMQRLGPGRYLLGAIVVSFAARAGGLFLMEGWMDAFVRGAIFITRLPEFALGMCLAAWLHRAPGVVDRWARSPLTWIAALVVYVLSTAASLALAGMIFAPFTLGAAALVLLLPAVGGLAQPVRGAAPGNVGLGGPTLLNSRGREGPTVSVARAGAGATPRLTRGGDGVVGWVGRHSYSLFLVHHLVLRAVLPEGVAFDPVRLAITLVAAVLATLVLAMLLEWCSSAIPASVTALVRRLGAPRVTLAAVLLLAIAYSGLLAGERYVRARDPQEVLGWGERPALRPDDRFGWTLIPDRRTRLRWESYDYVVEANGLGFPGPEYSPLREEGSLRILVTGDAFTSGEGVDTMESWPRLLERLLARKLGRRVEVLNFGMTGYGPSQYARVIEEFAPRYRPDLVIVEWFVNEYEDALTSDRAFLRSIGFGRPDPESAFAYLTLGHSRRRLSLAAERWRSERLLGRPAEHGYFLANLAAFERESPRIEEGASAARDCLRRIERAARAAGARTILLAAPAAMQVCPVERLEYWPKFVDVSDSSRFDLAQPQSIARELAAEAGVDYDDLRPAFANVEGCGFQPRNMHWTREGHGAVAEFVAARIAMAQLADTSAASQQVQQGH